jgi:hypothetical protein
MHHKGHESSSPRLVWVEGLNVGGWGCSECAWVFSPSDWPPGRSLEEITLELQAQLSEEFASHVCAEHPQVEAAKHAS